MGKSRKEWENQEKMGKSRKNGKIKKKWENQERKKEKE